MGLSGASPDFQFVVDASLLRAGEYYTICTDLDGATAALASGDTQQKVYVAPRIAAWRAGDEHKNTVQPAAGQFLEFSCSDCAFPTAIGYLSDDKCVDGNPRTSTSLLLVRRREIVQI